jgi:hypothetical protein
MASMLRQPIALLSFLAVLALTACDDGNANRLNSGDIAPAFTASSLGGAPVRHRERGLAVIAVNAGQSRQEVDAFIGRIGVTYPALLDEKAAISRQYGVVALPTTYFVGADGRIRGKVLGEADEATFERLAVDLLQ